MKKAALCIFMGLFAVSLLAGCGKKDSAEVYRSIEDAAVKGYQAVEDTVVSQYRRIEEAFKNAYLELQDTVVFFYEDE